MPLKLQLAANYKFIRKSIKLIIIIYGNRCFLCIVYIVFDAVVKLILFCVRCRFNCHTHFFFYTIDEEYKRSEKILCVHSFKKIHNNIIYFLVYLYYILLNVMFIFYLTRLFAFRRHLRFMTRICYSYTRNKIKIYDREARVSQLKSQKYDKTHRSENIK